MMSNTAFASTFTAPLLSHGSAKLCRSPVQISRVVRSPVSQPVMTSKPDGSEPNLPKIPQGFTGYSELMNGRAAMLGFTLAVVTELITGHGMLGQVGSIFEIVNMASALSN